MLKLFLLSNLFLIGANAFSIVKTPEAKINKSSVAKNSFKSRVVLELQIKSLKNSLSGSKNMALKNKNFKTLKTISSK